MKAIIIAIAIVSSLSACIPPIMPLPPLGCSSSNAMLIRDGNGGCYYVFIGC